jgi:hypothetical protein
MPMGVIDEPFLGPLTIALDAGIGEDDLACSYCKLNVVTVHFDQRRDALAVAAAWSTGQPEKGTCSWAVMAPAVLAKFNRDFNDRRYPELIDHDLITIDEAAAELITEAATLKRAAKKKRLTLLDGFCDMYLRRSDLLPAA